ncbi:unnamed protein product, partial [Mycena citricolor]
MEIRSKNEGTPIVPRLIHFNIFPEDKQNQGPCVDETSVTLSSISASLHIVLFPEQAFGFAKQFWQHTGLGISSRLAEHCLSLLPVETTFVPNGLQHTPRRAYNKHYSAKAKPSSPTESVGRNIDDLSLDHSMYVEERYGRNLPLSAAATAKRALRMRIAGVLVRDAPLESSDALDNGDKNADVAAVGRGVDGLSEDDVFLYPTGMAAIWNSHQLCLAVRPAKKSVCLGFTYTDTLKLLEKWGPGCHFIGDGNLDSLEQILEQQSASDPVNPPILAVFLEIPSNPLLRTADLPRLRSLADKYKFLVVIDETVGNFLNVAVIQYADIVVSSLPPKCSVATPTSWAEASYEDTYFDEDAIYMERNSRDFRRRVKVIDKTQEPFASTYGPKSIAGGSSSPIVKEVFYPRYVTTENYERCRIPGDPAQGIEEGGYGGLFSVTFASMALASIFFDNLSCNKGPSLGTNFTL